MVCDMGAVVGGLYTGANGDVYEGEGYGNCQCSIVYTVDTHLVLEYVVCCAAAGCKLRAATDENFCEAKLIERGRFEANLKSHQMWGDVVFNLSRCSFQLEYTH